MFFEKLALRDIPAWIISIGLVGIATSFVYIVWAQPPKFSFFGLEFGKEPAQASETKTESAENMVAFFRSQECPQGWTACGLATGRYIVGVAPQEKSRTVLAKGFRQMKIDLLERMLISSQHM